SSRPIFFRIFRKKLKDGKSNKALEIGVSIAARCHFQAISKTRQIKINKMTASGCNQLLVINHL
ncbi:hypothetical protein, partial [Leptolyngbya sp. FACHB-711]|uniref:hypothetical protein n=1 Tax=Leptolyngbya sp. FACHB-711 TaxID=2692813 RepID=UPI001A7E91BE